MSNFICKMTGRACCPLTFTPKTRAILYIVLVCTVNSLKISRCFDFAICSDPIRSDPMWYLFGGLLSWLDSWRCDRAERYRCRRYDCILVCLETTRKDTRCSIASGVEWVSSTKNAALLPLLPSDSFPSLIPSLNRAFEWNSSIFFLIIFSVQIDIH